MKTFKYGPEGWGLRYHDLPGQGRPLVFIHGLGCASSFDYPSIAAEPCLAGRRMILVDLLGFGFSSRPEEFSYRIEEHANSIVALVNHLQLSTLDLFGHSMGGAVAISAATQLGHQLGALVLGEPNLDPGGGTYSRKIAAQNETSYRQRKHQLFIRAAIQEGNEAWAATMSNSAPYAVHRSASSLIEGSNPTWRTQLYELPLSRTVIFGEHSLPDDNVEQLANQGIHIAIVPQAGHAMAWENPQGLAQAIADACVAK